MRSFRYLGLIIQGNREIEEGTGHHMSVGCRNGVMYLEYYMMRSC